VFCFACRGGSVARILASLAADSNKRRWFCRSRASPSARPAQLAHRLGLRGLSPSACLRSSPQDGAEEERAGLASEAASRAGERARAAPSGSRQSPPDRAPLASASAAGAAAQHARCRIAGQRRQRRRRPRRQGRICSWRRRWRFAFVELPCLLFARQFCLALAVPWMRRPQTTIWHRHHGQWRHGQRHQPTGRESWPNTR
jgi:hypothetical protein